MDNILTPMDEILLTPLGDELVNFEAYEESYINIVTLNGDWLVTPDGVEIINFEAILENLLVTPADEELLSLDGNNMEIGGQNV